MSRWRHLVRGLRPAEVDSLFAERGVDDVGVAGFPLARVGSSRASNWSTPTLTLFVSTVFRLIDGRSLGLNAVAFLVCGGFWLRALIATRRHPRITLLFGTKCTYVDDGKELIALGPRSYLLVTERSSGWTVPSVSVHDRSQTWSGELYGRKSRVPQLREMWRSRAAAQPFPDPGNDATSSVG
ncbi:MAG: hypothetical protein Q7V57_09340 [Actinomycetota bacterium]|nr:hypothetical protein [Actinomycetota bacterium]